jgi:ABC-2 type transport system ATP-binding protein
VDAISRRQFWELVYEMAGRGVTVFVTTHHMDEAEYCDRLALIYRGELIATGSPTLLKSQFMRETVLDVECERPQDAMGVIENVEGIQEVALFGKGLHAVARPGVEVLAPLRAALGAAGFRLERLEPITPSLEDVFVSLIEARDRAEQPQQAVQA